MDASNRRGQNRKVSEGYQRPSARRTASEAWSRLKPAQIDALQAYGLPSKGETRLNDSRTQEIYYNKIVERYLKFCAASSSGQDLDSKFKSLSVSQPQANSLASSRWASKPAATTASTTTSNEMQTDRPRPSAAGTVRPGENTTMTAITQESLSSTELQAIFVAMRKLREALVATRRSDMFAQQAFIFVIRAAILTRSWESYHPAIMHLLHVIHPRTALSEQELAEFATYHILDLSCRQQDYNAAHAVKLRFGLRDDARLITILKTLVDGNWVGFWRMRQKVDGYQRALLGFAEEEIRWHALRCLGRTYFTEDRKFVERSANLEWNKLVGIGVGWDLLADKDKVVIRKPKST